MQDIYNIKIDRLFWNEHGIIFIRRIHSKEAKRVLKMQEATLIEVMRWNQDMVVHVQVSQDNSDMTRTSIVTCLRKQCFWCAKA